MHSTYFSFKHVGSEEFVVSGEREKGLEDGSVGRNYNSLKAFQVD